MLLCKLLALFVNISAIESSRSARCAITLAQTFYRKLLLWNRNKLNVKIFAFESMHAMHIINLLIKSIKGCISEALLNDYLCVRTSVSKKIFSCKVWAGIVVADAFVWMWNTCTAYVHPYLIYSHVTILLFQKIRVWDLLWQQWPDFQVQDCSSLLSKQKTWVLPATSGSGFWKKYGAVLAKPASGLGIISCLNISEEVVLSLVLKLWKCE